MTMINNKIKFTLLLFSTVFLTQCEDVLDKTDLGNITSDVVFVDPVLAEANLNRLYLISSPEWGPGNSSITDNGPNSAGITNDFMYGRVPDNSNSDTYQGLFSNIREINIFLNGLDNGTLEDEDTNPMRGQALALRAINYLSLVRTYGGVPIVTEVLTPDDDGLNRPRNTSSECFAQMVADLDAAESLLPNVYDSNDNGRLTRGAAMAIKGRILLRFASEQFDPDQTKNRWQAAYDALTAAKSNLDANGKGLHPSYADLWFDDSSGNPELVWTRLYNTNFSHTRDASVRTYRPGFGGGRVDTPTLGLLDAYPMRDGKKIDDPTSAYTYDPLLVWQNRDPRFEATVVWNGASWPIDEPSPFKTSELYWSFQDNTTETETDDNGITFTGFQCRKAVDTSFDHEMAQASTTQWIEMRYAEVLLNLAEAANEIGQGAEALNILFDIRARAGIENLDGRYGLDAGLEGDQVGMRDVILNERRVEFAFEAKRSSDLIRRRLYGSLNGTQRMGYFITTTPAFDALADTRLEDRIALENAVLSGTIDLDDPVQYQTYFTTETYSVEENSIVPGQAGTPINFLDNYYFLDIPESILQRNPALEQTEGWPGGSFDPTE